MSVPLLKLSENSRFRKQYYICALVLLIFVVCRYFLNGLLKGWEPGLFPDASGHYITGMLVKSYFLEDFGSNPFIFIADFHEKYPFVGIGLWPPFFHLVEGIWMVLFSASRTSILLFDAFIVGLSATILFHYSMRALNRIQAFLAGLTLCLTYQFLVPHELLSIDLFTAMLIFAAMMGFSDFLERPSMSRALFAGTMTVIALLSKGTAVALALAFPVAILLNRRLNLAKTLAFWVIPGFVAVVAGPWYILTSSYSSQGFRYQWGIDYFIEAVPVYSGYIFLNLGVVTLFFVGAGIWTIFRTRDSNKLLTYWYSLIALTMGVFLFQVIMPVAHQDRYIAALYFPMIIIAFKGIGYSFAKFDNLKPYLMAGLAANALLISITYAKPFAEGTSAIIPELEKTLPHNGTAILLSASPEIEGELASEILMNLSEQKLLNTFLVRGVKLLGGGGYNTHDYVPRFDTVEQVKMTIRETNVSFIVHEDSERAEILKHNRQVADLVLLYPEVFEIISEIEISANRTIKLIRVLDTKGDEPNMSIIRETNRNKVYQSFKEKFEK